MRRYRGDTATRQQIQWRENGLREQGQSTGDGKTSRITRHLPDRPLPRIVAARCDAETRADALPARCEGVQDWACR